MGELKYDIQSAVPSLPMKAGGCDNSWLIEKFLDEQ